MQRPVLRALCSLTKTRFSGIPGSSRGAELWGKARFRTAAVQSLTNGSFSRRSSFSGLIEAGASLTSFVGSGGEAGSGEDDGSGARPWPRRWHGGKRLHWGAAPRKSREI